MEDIDATPALTFGQFYRNHYLPEHRHPANVALHLAGTVAGLAFVVWVLAAAPLYWLPLFLAVHALPGLIGHRLFERNATVGDVRVLRRDFSPLWFIAANHLLLWRLVRHGTR